MAWLQSAFSGSQAAFGIRQHLAVTDAQCLDPALLPQRQPNKEAQFNELGVRKMLVQARPERVIGK